LYGRELEDALKGELHGEKLDLIVFDECVMGMMENAYALRDVANVMVASEELVPETGFDNSDWLSRLEAAPQMSGDKLGQTLVESYARTYHDIFPCYTMAAVDLGRIPHLAEVVSNFADALITMLPSERDAIRSARAKCANYGGSCAFGSCLHSIDLQRFSELVAAGASNSRLRQSARDVVNTTQEVIVRAMPKESGDSRGPHGIAIYFPPDASAYCSDRIVRCAYQRNNHRFPLDFVNNERWTLFLDAYAKTVTQIGNPDAPQPDTCDSPKLDCAAFP
jgi:hypothetical protein